MKTPAPSFRTFSLFSCRPRTVCRLALALAVGAGLGTVHANEVTWTGGAGGSWDWSQGANWAGGVAPEINNNSIIHFAGNGTSTGGNAWNNLGWWNSFHQIIFDAGTASFNLQGDTPFISPNGSTPGAIINNSSNTQSISFYKMALRAGTIVNAASGDLTFGSGVDPVWLDPSSLGSAITVTGASGRSIVFNGVIADGSGNNGVIIKEGEATLKLVGNSTYSGGLVASAGVIEVQNNNALGTGTTRVDTGAWVSLQSDTVVSNSINATGGTLGWHFTSGSGAYAGAITLTANSTVSLANYYGFGGVSGTINGTISGAGSLTVTNKDRGGTSQSGGVLTLTQNNTYTGDTLITGGTLLLASGASIASSAAIDVASGASFNVSGVSGFSLASGQTLRGSGQIVGAVSVGAGTLAIGNSPGTMTFANDLALTSLSTAAFEVNGFGAGEFDLALGGSGSQSVAFGGVLNVVFQSGFNTLGAVKIFDFEGYSGSFDSQNFSGLANGYSASFDNLTGTLTVVPEPGTWALIGVGLSVFVLRRRRTD